SRLIVPIADRLACVRVIIVAFEHASQLCRERLCLQTTEDEAKDEDEDEDGRRRRGWATTKGDEDEDGRRGGRTRTKTRTLRWLCRTPLTFPRPRRHPRHCRRRCPDPRLHPWSGVLVTVLSVGLASVRRFGRYR